MILATFALVAQRTEHLTTDQTAGGSNPPKRSVSLVKLVITPGCGPGDRGFKSRMTPKEKNRTFPKTKGHAIFFYND